MEEKSKKNLVIKEDGKVNVQRLVGQASKVLGFRESIFIGAILEMLGIIICLIFIASDAQLLIYGWVVGWFAIMMLSLIVPLLIFLLGQVKFVINSNTWREMLSISGLNTMKRGISIKFFVTYYYTVIASTYLFRLCNDGLELWAIYLFWGVMILLMIGYSKASKNIDNLIMMQMSDKISDKNLSILPMIANIVRNIIHIIICILLIIDLSGLGTVFEGIKYIFYLFLFIAILHMTLHIMLGVATIRYNNLLKAARHFKLYNSNKEFQENI